MTLLEIKEKFFVPLKFRIFNCKYWR